MKFTLDDAKRVATIDAPGLSHDCDSFVQVNSRQYWITCNIWGGIVRNFIDATDDVALYHTILRDGIIATTKALNNDFLSWVQCLTRNDDYQRYEVETLKLPQLSPLFRHWMNHFNVYIYDTSLTDFGDDTDTKMSWSSQDIAIMAQLSRFTRKFSPRGCDIVTERSLKDFLSINNRCKLLSRREPNPRLVGFLREIIASYFDKRKRFVGGIIQPYYDGKFSSGSTLSGAVCVGHRLSDWRLPYYADPMYPLDRASYDSTSEAFLTKKCRVDESHSFHTYGRYEDRRGHMRYRLHEWDYVKVTAVAKDYKSDRIIAKEEVTRGWYLQAIDQRIWSSLRNKVKERLPIHDQVVNQELAFVGSVLNTCATIDLTSASDSISCGFARSVLPYSISSEIDKYRGKILAIGSGEERKSYVSHIWGTSGSPITFKNESIIFLSIADLGTAYAKLFSACTEFLSAEEEYIEPTAMGDDLIVDNRAYDTVVDLLSLFGFKVNVEKSYSDSLFKESCGADWFDGTPVDPVYISRDCNFGSSAKAYTSLVNLNNSVFPIIDGDAKMFLYDLLNEVMPAKFRSWHDDSDIFLSQSLLTDPIGVFGMNRKINAKYDRRRVEDCEGASLEVFQDRVTCATKDRPDKNAKRWPVPDMYYYVEFLIHGPYFEDPFLELLGVSFSRRRPNDCYEKFDTVFCFNRII